MTYDKVEKQEILGEMDYVFFEATSLDSVETGGLVNAAACCCSCCCVG